MTNADPGFSTEWLSILPWFVPSVALALGFGLMVSRRLARRLVVRRTVAVLLVVSVGAILGATLTPTGAEAELGQPLSCDFSKVWPELDQLRRINDESLNVLLFVPLGTTVALVRARRPLIVLAGAALVFPVSIEAIQALAPALERGCESGDVVDNVSGVVAGLAIGSVLRAFLAPGPDVL